MVAALAQEIITPDKELAGLDALINQKITELRRTRTLLNMPASGPS